MDKQQFDHIENRIRKAAEEISTPVSDAAWEKMQVLLDQEFSKDHRRRGGIWWWFSLLVLLLAGAGVYLYQSNKPGQNNKMSPENTSHNVPSVQDNLHLEVPGKGANNEHKINNKQSATTPSEPSVPRSDNPFEKPAKDAASTSSNDDHIAGSAGKKKDKTTRHIKSKTPSVANFKSREGFKTLSRTEKRSTQNLYGTPANDGVNNRVQQIQDKGSKAGDLPGKGDSDKTENNTPGKPAGVDSPQNTTSTSTSPPEAVTQSDSSSTPDSVTKKPVTRSRVPDSKGFYIIASIAGDATGIKKIPTTDIKPVYGIGVGYSFNKRLSVQTGFYTGKRIYTAGPDDYKVKPGSYVAKIISADAECLIYDIPISVRYNVLPRKMYNIYFAAGLSTYILKRETYDMHFYNPSGAYRHMAYTYNNNTDYLSILNLSAGFERKLSRAIYIQAEPYLKLPLSGLGEGNVKLYSGGIQAGIRYQYPHKKR